jgi:hypothetical protein
MKDTNEKQSEHNNIDFRKIAEQLWLMLDDIAYIGDAIKPNDYESFVRYNNAVERITSKRGKYFRSDNHNLYTVNEWEDYMEKYKIDIMSAFRKPL